MAGNSEERQDNKWEIKGAREKENKNGEKEIGKRKQPFSFSKV